MVKKISRQEMLDDNLLLLALSNSFAWTFRSQISQGFACLVHTVQTRI
jgi:hypothetical protein